VCPPATDASIGADTRVGPYKTVVHVAAERIPELRAIHPDVAIEPAIAPPPSRTARTWTRDEAIVELLRGRLGLVGPTTARALADSLGIPASDADAALLALEADGVAMRGSFEKATGENAECGEKDRSASPADSAVRRGQWQWCDRRLLARIHRYTLNRLRAEIEPVSPADFMRFLFRWQHVEPAARLTGVDGLRSVIEALDGFELAADAWERSVLPARVEGYEPALLDTLSLTGDVGWARLTSSRGATHVIGTTPVALFLREHADAWAALKGYAADDEQAVAQGFSPDARRVFDALRIRGASFIPELVAASGLTEADVRAALADLVAAGLAASDGFGGLRAIVRAASGRPVCARANVTGRWSLVAAAASAEEPHKPATLDDREAAVELQARTLLRRYGIVFRKLLAREANVAPWRELARVYRRLEARGEIRGGRFVTGMSGEQFALGDGIERLREVRRSPADGRLHVISAADPLNLAGIVTTGERVRAIAASRIVYRDGVPIAAMEGDYVRPLIAAADVAPALASDVASLLAGRPMPPVISGFVGRMS